MELTTYANKKSASKASHRQVGRLASSIKVESVDYLTQDDRVAVQVNLKHSEAEAATLDLQPLDGFKIAYRKPAKPMSNKRKGFVETQPHSKVYPCREGSRQAKAIDLLAKGATLEQLRTVCVKKDGTVWSDASIYSLLYYDIRNKGAGIRTTWLTNDDGTETPQYHLVLPEGVEKFPEHTPRQS